jgi:hypothetical protein
MKVGLISRARDHVHRARLDAEILYINLRASLDRKSNPGTMSEKDTSRGPLPLGRLGPEGRRGSRTSRAAGSRDLKMDLKKRCEIKTNARARPGRAGVRTKTRVPSRGGE